MKQHITIEQLEQTRATTIEKIISRSLTACENNSQIAKEINIGKMMEVIMSRNISVKILAYKIYDSVAVELYGEKYHSFLSKTLCDALWEATKFVLESEDN